MLSIHDNTCQDYTTGKVVFVCGSVWGLVSSVLAQLAARFGSETHKMLNFEKSTFKKLRR